MQFVLGDPSKRDSLKNEIIELEKNADMKTILLKNAIISNIEMIVQYKLKSNLLDKRINQVYRILKNEDDFSEWSWDDVESEFGFEVSSFKLEVLPENIKIFENKIPFTEQDCIEVLEKGWQERYGNYTLITDLDRFLSKFLMK